MCFYTVSKRIINLGPVHIGRDSPEPQHQPVGVRVICGHCSNIFLVGHSENKAKHKGRLAKRQEENVQNIIES